MKNLAAGYKDPFVGWYDKEKVHYDKDMADGVLDGYDADGNKVGNCGHYFNILETGYTHYGCASIASRWFHLQDFDSIEGFKRLVTDDEYVEGHEILGVGPNGEYYREDGKPWTCHWEMVTPDDYLREKYGDRSYSAEEYYSLFMKYYNKVYGTLDPSYQQAVDDARAALEAAQTKASAANAASAEKAAAETAAKQAVASAQAAVSADAQKKSAVQMALSDAQAQAGDAQVQLDAANAEVAGKQSSRIRRRSVLHPMRRPLAGAKQAASAANTQLKAAQEELSDARQALYDVSSDELKADAKARCCRSGGAGFCSGKRQCEERRPCCGAGGGGEACRRGVERPGRVRQGGSRRVYGPGSGARGCDQRWRSSGSRRCDQAACRLRERRAGCFRRSGQ